MTDALEVVVSTEAEAWSVLPQVEALAERAARAAYAGAAGDAGAVDAERFAADGRPREVSLVLADDALVHRLNRDYRGKDKPTNVLSFALMDGAEEEPGGASFEEADAPVLLGDVILAFETVEGEARSQGKALADHVSHLVVHGVLHLLGYDHEKDEDADRMERLETRILAGLGIADPYADSVRSAPEPQDDDRRIRQ
ncbi:rRNA maturation RNase YbeY [Arenibaculum pallidiluteum]|uniref:rRNA maturation RNase YbeY n=1 Tax=Arenibaculum pallidiluteum TaxID=2812559 RepID=UPI001A96F40D|nr:rRNA maturation RNase YbeY [Arenibaculum pallidiluteum]